MKLTVTIPGSRFAANLPDETCVDHYRAFVDALLDAVAGDDTYDYDVQEPESEPESAHDKAPEPEPELEPDLSDGDKSVDANDSVITAKKGFLHLKCPHCGSEFGFYSKHERDHVVCRECGQEFGFDRPLVALYVNCECGNTFKYFTNRTEPFFDIECLDCKAPVTVEYIAKRNLYQTVKRG